MKEIETKIGQINETTILRPCFKLPRCDIAPCISTLQRVGLCFRNLKAFVFDLVTFLIKKQLGIKYKFPALFVQMCNQ